MKILHTSDLHLCSRLTSRLDPVKAQTRRRELLKAFEELIQKARGHGAEIMIIAGDLFDEQKALTSAKARIRDAVASATDITFLYLPGNHEGDALSDYPMPENFVRMGEEGWTCYKRGDVSFYARKTLSPGMFGELTPDGAKNIAILHGELKPTGSSEMTVSANEARGRGLDYIALGHYHTYSKTKIDDRCTAVYSGAPEGRGFDETGALGYIIINTDGEGVTHRFYEGAKRRLFDTEVDVGGLSTINSIEARIRAALSEAKADDLVRITLTGYRESDKRPDLPALTDRISGDFWYFELRDKTRIKFDPEAMRYTKSLKGEFISLVMADNALSEEEKTSIINAGILALMGEDAD